MPYIILSLLFCQRTGLVKLCKTGQEQCFITSSCQLYHVTILKIRYLGLLCFLYTLDTCLLEFSCFLHCRNVTITAGSIISFNVSNFKSAAGKKKLCSTCFHPCCDLLIPENDVYIFRVGILIAQCCCKYRLCTVQCVLFSGVFFCLIMEDKQSEVSSQQNIPESQC